MTTGILNTSQLTQDQARKSFAAQITRLQPNGNAMLFGLTAMLQTETALQVEHGFFTKTMIFPQMTIGAGGQTATDTNWTVTSTVNLLPGMVFKVNSSGEQVLLQGINGTASVQVARGVGSVAPAAIAAAVNVYQVGTGFEESSLRPNALEINPVRVTNLTQIFRNTWAISGSTEATQMLVGDTNVAENRADCATFHATNIETGIFFGQKFAGTRNGQPFRLMDGIVSIVSNLAYYPPIYSSPNVTVAGSTTNYTQFETAWDPLFNQTTDPKSANERIMFVGGTAKKAINNIGRLNGTYFMVDGQTSWGLQFQTIKIARGTFRLIEHPLFNSNVDWQKLAIGVDMAAFNLAYLGGRKTQSKDFNMNGNDAADNGIDAVGGTLTTELTTVIKNPPAMGVMSNLTAGAAG